MTRAARRALTPVALSISLARVTAAQDAPSHVRGSVYDSVASAPIAGVDVVVLGTALSARTDSAGRFAITLPGGATYLLRVRRLGFRPVTAEVTPPARDTVDLAFQLAPVAQLLSAVAVTERETRYSWRLQGFADRLRTSAAPRSAFVTRADIERRNPARLSDMIQYRGGRCGLTSYTVYLDGHLAPSGLGTPRGAPPVDAWLPGDVEAMEIYRGVGQIPAQYNATRANGAQMNCVILIWTR